MKNMKKGIVYDAAAVSCILGIPCECNDPVPEAGDGEVVIYYGGWDLSILRACEAERMHDSGGDERKWRAKPGYYSVTLRVPGSNNHGWSEQFKYLKTLRKPYWRPAPITVAAAALLIHLTETGDDLLQGDRGRCVEYTPIGHRTVLSIIDGRVAVFGEAGFERKDGRYWLSAVRKFRTSEAPKAS